jgi:hypothetical protein
MQSTTPVVVACPCPGTPHAEDTVYLRDKLGLAGGATLQRLVVEVNQSGSDQAETSGRLAEAYLRVGVADWTFTDENGRKVPVNPDNLQRLLLDDFSLAMPVADRADELYLQPVLGFLLAKAASAVEAILDLHYPDGRHRDDFWVARWRLQVIADKQVGVRWRAEMRAEKESVDRLRSTAKRM